MNRLQSYVRRTILTAAKDYANGNRRTILTAAKDYANGNRRTAASTEAAFRDAMNGTDTGWWNDLIYTADMLVMAHRYRKDIAAALEQYADEMGEPWHRHNGESADVVLSALVQGPYSFEQYQEESPAGKRAEMALLGLRFAVEWYAGELASQYAPNL